jgi:hypothetical protein
VRILRGAVGIMDGISLSHLIPGTTYDVPAELGYWLMSRGVAEQDSAASGDVVVPLDNPYAYEQLTQGVSIIPPLADAADKAASRRRVPRKKPS